MQTPFSGFPIDAFHFLNELEKNNNKKYFDNNRSRYKESLIEPAKNFISAIAPFFEQLNSSVRTEPKFNQTIMRLNKDMRFSKGNPYRTFLLIHFGRFKLDSEFYIYLDGKGLSYGLFINNSRGENLFFKENLAKNKNNLLTIFNEYELNDKFSLLNIEKEMTMIVKKFNIHKHFVQLEINKWFVLEKSFPISNKICSSSKILTETIKAFSRLYPLYCFAISPVPIQLIEEFEDKMGIAD